MTKTILLLPKFVLSKMSHESEHSESIWKRILLARRIVPCRTTSVANSLRKQREKFNTLRKWRSSPRSQKPTSKQAVKETTQSWGETSLLRRHSSWAKLKKTEEENKVRCKCFLRVSEFLGEVVCSRMKLLYSFYVSVVCLKRQNWMWIQVHYRTVHPDNENSLVFNLL